MSDYIVHDSELTSIANAIRGVTGGSTSLAFPTAFVTEIEGIGGTIDRIIDRTISEIYNSRVSVIGNYAFQSCPSLTTVSFPNCTSIGNYAFYSCTSLTTVSFPNCTSIGNSAFYRCTSLTTVSFPNCTSIDSYTFAYCTNLTTISFPNCTNIGSYAFGYCTNLTTISFPNCTNIGNYAFVSCTNLTTAYFFSHQSIASCVFMRCYCLKSIYFLGSSVGTLSVSAFTSTPISNYSIYNNNEYGSIYVRASLLASFKTATNWSVYSARMVGLTDAQIAAL